MYITRVLCLHIFVIVGRYYSYSSEGINIINLSKNSKFIVYYLFGIHFVLRIASLQTHNTILSVIATNVKYLLSGRSGKQIQI